MQECSWMQLVEYARPQSPSATRRRSRAEELVPFGAGRGAVFFAGAELAAAGDEGPVAVDGFLGVDRLVAHDGVYVLVSEDELGDVRGHAVEETGREHCCPRAEWVSWKTGRWWHLPC
jgi:hypothetical protein